MNYNDNDDELQRIRARRQRRAAAGRHRDELDDAYCEGEYGENYSRRSSRSASKEHRSGRAGATGRSASGSGQSSAGSGKRQSRGMSAADRAVSRYMAASTEDDYLSERKSRSKVSSKEAQKNNSHGRKNSAKGHKKRRWPLVLLAVLLIVLGYEAYLFLHRPAGYWNVAVFGVDSRDGNTKNALADVQMICSVNRSTGEIRLVSVYRDTYLKINSEGTYHKINEAYFKGGQKQAVAALEENLDLKIDDYAAFNWKAVAEAINVLGGIDLEITPAEFKYINAFITETVNSTGLGSVQLSEAGMNHLDGVQAVAYSRLRLMDTDFQRTERQRKVVSLALEKAKQADAGTLAGLVKAILPQISTSININDLLPMAKDVGKYYIGETAGFPFSRQTARVGKMDCVIPTTLESNDVLLHKFLYGDEVVYTPSAAVKKISAAISEETGLYEEGQPAPSGSGSGSGSSTSGSSSSEKQTAAPEPAETVPETEPAAESTEESSEEAVIEELGSKKQEMEEREENGKEEIGPGISGNTGHKPSVSETKEEQGPGVRPGSSGSGASRPERPGAFESEAPQEAGTSGAEDGSSNASVSSSESGPGEASGSSDSENSKTSGGPGEAGSSGNSGSENSGPGVQN
ncbi:MAG: LCP family protein [Enterocloster sp.]